MTNLRTWLDGEWTPAQSLDAMIETAIGDAAGWAERAFLEAQQIRATAPADVAEEQAGQAIYTLSKSMLGNTDKMAADLVAIGATPAQQDRLRAGRQNAFVDRIGDMIPGIGLWGHA